MEWDIQWIKCNPQFGQYSNYVMQVGWICVAKDGNLKAQSYGVLSLQADSQQPNFVPYQNLTKQQVLQWIFNNPAEPDLKKEVERGLSEQIANMKKPTLVDTPVPW